MLIEMDSYDISDLIKGLGYDEYCDLLSDYVVDCCCDGWNIKKWLANTYNTTIICFENEEEALKYVNDENLTLGYDCNIYNSMYGCILDRD